MHTIILVPGRQGGYRARLSFKKFPFYVFIFSFYFPGPFQQHRTLDWLNGLQPDASSLFYLTANTTSLTDKHLNPIRENMGKQWKNCARKLGFTESQIDEIDHDYERDGLKEKVYQMLQKWLMREGTKGATVGKLAQALHQCCRTDLLNQLIQASQS